MPAEMSFRFPICPVHPGGDRPIAEVEQELLETVQHKEAELAEALWEVAWFYSNVGRPSDALELMKRASGMAGDPEKKAACLLALGQLMEQLQDFPSAMAFYSQAFSLEPACTGTWYLINNNLGFCLNTLGRHEDAEAYCRAAIGIDPNRHNGYKNLGISLEGRRDFRRAAEAYLAAVQANAADDRALGHLESLYHAHPQVAIEVPEFEAKLARCREAVALVNGLRGRTISLQVKGARSPAAEQLASP